MSDPSVTIVGEAERIPGSSGVKVSGNRILQTHRVKWLVDAGAFDGPTDPRRFDSYSTRMKILFDSAGKLPTIGITKTPDGAICSGLDAERIESNPRYWEAVAEFTTQVNDFKTENNNTGQTPNPDPTTWIPVWKKTYAIEDWYAPHDARGFALLNSAGTRFDEPLNLGNTVSTWTFYQYEDPATEDADIQTRNQVMNSEEFNGYEKYTLLLSAKDSERTWVNNYEVLRVDYELKYRFGFRNGFKVTDDGVTWTDCDTDEAVGWRAIYLDVGPQYISGSKAYQFRAEGDGQSTMANLNGSGGWAGATSGVQNEPAKLAWHRHYFLDFNDFLRV